MPAASPASMTPSATITCGQRAPQSPALRAARRERSWAAASAVRDDRRDARQAGGDEAREQRSAADEAVRSLVGGDGLEPPTLSV